MTAQLAAEHPYWFVKDLVESWPEIIDSLNFSYYRYLPQSLEDPRKEFTIPAKEFLRPIQIERIIDGVPEGHELAFHSRVTLAKGELMHIPLVDMSTSSAAQLEKLRPFLGALYSQFQWYKSGRSFHGYAANLVDDHRWAAIMGRLLLANQKGLSPTVDPRWVGHRLIAGYSALRWTKNTDYYIELPQALERRR